jgi:hypothetical protein
MRDFKQSFTDMGQFPGDKTGQMARELRPVEADSPPRA